MICHFKTDEISDARDRIDLDAICTFLSGSSWAAQRSRDTLADSHSSSISRRRLTSLGQFPRSVTRRSLRGATISLAHGHSLACSI